MSFGKRMRAKQPKSRVFMVALLASMGMGATIAPPAQASIAPSSQAPHEFVNERPAAKKKPAPVQNRVDPKKKDLTSFDSRKARRRILMQMAERENTGRGWRHVRRALRHGNAPILLSTPAWQLQIMARTMRLTMTPRAVA